MASRLAWLPAATAGAAAAASAEIAVALLLYVRGGFLGALTLILCAEAAALGFGLWSAPRDAAPPWTGARRAWLLLLAALAAAGAVAASWEALGGLAATWLARGLGLAFLAALPLYAAGAVLGAPALAEGDPPARVGPPAAAGAALGFALVGLGGTVLRLAPLAFVGALVVVSGGALVHARLLEERDLRWREWAERATARWDERPMGAPPVPPPAGGS